MSKYILSADLQLDWNPKNEYRWSVFDWYRELSKEHNTDGIILLGDILDRKDHLPNKHIHRALKALWDLRDEGMLYVLLGNHDFGKDRHSVLHLLDYMADLDCFVLGNEHADLLPCDGDWWVANGWWPHINDPEENTNVAFCHETVPGIFADDMRTSLDNKNAQQMIQFLGNVPYVFAGDIHGHQVVTLDNDAETEWIYTGAPHHVRFGEEWEPQCIIAEIDEGGVQEWESIKRPADQVVKKVNLEVGIGEEPDPILESYGLKKGDRIRLMVAVHSTSLNDLEATFQHWQNHCDYQGIELDSRSWALMDDRKDQAITDESNQVDVFDEYCQREGLDDPTVDYGEEIMGAVK